jgi:hypothetical protein
VLLCGPVVSTATAAAAKVIAVNQRASIKTIHARLVANLKIGGGIAACESSVAAAAAAAVATSDNSIVEAIGGKPEI